MFISNDTSFIYSLSPLSSYFPANVSHLTFSPRSCLSLFLTHFCVHLFRCTFPSLPFRSVTEVEIVVRKQWDLTNMSWEIKDSYSEAIGMCRFPYWVARKDQENRSYRKKTQMHTSKMKYTHTKSTDKTLSYHQLSSQLWRHSSSKKCMKCFFTLQSAHYETLPPWELLSGHVFEWGTMDTDDQMSRDRGRGATVTWPRKGLHGALQGSRLLVI